MRRLVCACVVRNAPKTGFLATRPKCSYDLDESRQASSPGPMAIKLSSSSPQPWAWKFNRSYKLKYRQIKRFHALSLSDVVFIMLINATIVGILTFMSRINFVLSWAEYEKGFTCIRSGPGGGLLWKHKIWIQSRYRPKAAKPHYIT